MFFQYVEQLCEQLFNLFITVAGNITVATVFFLLFYALNHSRYAAFCKMTAIFYCVA